MFTKLPRTIVTCYFSLSSIQTQKRYPTSFDKISILTWRWLVISSQIFSCEQSFSNFLLAQYLISVAATLITLYNSKKYFPSRIIKIQYVFSEWMSLQTMCSIDYHISLERSVIFKSPKMEHFTLFTACWNVWNAEITNKYYKQSAKRIGVYFLLNIGRNVCWVFNQ